jgi:hypothetical protein
MLLKLLTMNYGKFMVVANHGIYTPSANMLKYECLSSVKLSTGGGGCWISVDYKFER